MELLPTKILLIEDDEEDVILLKKLLAKIPNTNYQVTWESSYETGLQCLLEAIHDICLLDYRLGAHNGIELVKEARNKGYAGPIILLTGADEGEVDIQALQAGADDYINKGQLQAPLVRRIIRYAIERRKAEHERERLVREQIAARELEKRRNEFISMVVHELKTPLTSLKGYAQLLRRRCTRSGDQQTAELATRMDAQIIKLTELIDDFQDVTRLAGGKLQFREEYFPFDTLIDEIVEEIQLTTDKQKICCEGKTDKVIWGDRMRIGQVITNLLTNAIKYAPQSDTILVKTSSDAKSITLCVQDFGPGIPKALQDKIFDPFYRVDTPELRAAPGLGLGLHIASEIIKRQEGHLWVESEEGKGSTFCFTLPVDRQHMPEQEPVVQEGVSQ